MGALRRARGNRSAPRGGEEIEELDGLHSVLEALRAGRRRLHRLEVAEGVDRGDLAEILEAAGRAGVAVERVASERIRAREEGNPQRVLLRAGPLPVFRIEELCEVDRKPRWLVVLDGVEDPQNLGAIARVAEAAGAAGLVIAERRVAPLSPAASRASAGALEWLPVARAPNLVRALKHLKEKGFWVLGADGSAVRSLYEMPDPLLQGDLAVALGAEGRGLRPGVLEQVDHLVRIPMAGEIASLNVATAGAIVLFELVRRSRLAV